VGGWPYGGRLLMKPNTESARKDIHSLTNSQHFALIF
jgi:hypothetical protein